MTDELNTVDDVQQGVVDLAGENVSADDEGSFSSAEVAPAKQSRQDNQAFAAVRRELEAKQKQIADANQRLAALQDKEQYLTEVLQNEYGLDGDLLDMVDQLAALQSGLSVDEIRQERLLQEQQRQFINDIQHEKDFYKNIAVEKLKSDLLAEIKNVYPDCSANSVDEFGLDFANLLQGGVSPAVAYAAVNFAQNAASTPLPPDIGAVNNIDSPDSDYFTREQVKQMTKEQVHKHWKKIQRSRAKWR